MGRGTFYFSKYFFEGGWGGSGGVGGRFGGVHVGGLTKIGCKGGNSTLKTSCIKILNVISYVPMSVLLHRSIKFPEFEHNQRVIYVQNVFLYFEYDDFVT